MSTGRSWLNARKSAATVSAISSMAACASASSVASGVGQAVVDVGDSGVLKTVPAFLGLRRQLGQHHQVGFAP